VINFDASDQVTVICVPL